MLQNKDLIKSNLNLPVDVVLSPEWWFHNEKITFDEDFFFHPLRRVEVEQQMEKVLYERWGKYGLGRHHAQKRPEIGAVHLAAGYLLSEMLGCTVMYSDAHPPAVVPLNMEGLTIDEASVFESDAFLKTVAMWNKLEDKFGYLSGDINWGGILNLALDLKGQQIFIDMMLEPDLVKAFFAQLARIIQKFTSLVFAKTGSTSISVNRLVGQLSTPVYLHSECSHTMISAADYENFLLPFDIEFSRINSSFGVHYCGVDPHRMVDQFAKIPSLDFLDVGWGGDLKILREHLPKTFLNIRLSPVDMINQSNAEIRDAIITRVKESGTLDLTGVCCINIDEKVSDEKITTMFKTVEELKKGI